MEIVKISSTELNFIFHSATSTLGNLIQNELLKDPNVIFAGYSCPHPLETRMIIKVITSGKGPREVITTAINNIISVLDELEITVNSPDSFVTIENEYNDKEDK